MIPEIGIMIGAFILAQLTPSRWKAVSGGVTAVAVLITLLVIADLGLRGFQGRSLAFLLEGPPESELVEDIQPETESEAPPAPTFTVTTADGGSITTQLGYGIAVAKGSSLQREWVAIHDSALPLDLVGTPGVKTVYISKKYSGEYRYRADFEIEPREPLRAFEVRFLTFDVWGNHVRTLSFERVVDVAAESKQEFQGEWSLYSENDVASHYASIAYVARARLADGRVIEGDSEPVLAEARKFFAKFSPSDLEPRPPRKAPDAETEAAEEGE